MVSQHIVLVSAAIGFERTSYCLETMLSTHWYYLNCYASAVGHRKTFTVATEAYIDLTKHSLVEAGGPSHRPSPLIRRDCTEFGRKKSRKIRR